MYWEQSDVRAGRESANLLLPNPGESAEIIRRSGGSGAAVYQSGSGIGASVRVFQPQQEAGENDLLPGRWNVSFCEAS